MLSRLVRRFVSPLLCLGSLLAVAGGSAAAAERLTVWDLVLGTKVDQLPDWEAFKGYACGTNGGPPSRALSGWSDFGKCRAEANGLHEVYFEYDDEQEYIARAQELVNGLGRIAGTTELGFPIIASALLDDGGVLRGLRFVTDPRPDTRTDNFYVEQRSRQDFNQLAALEAPRLDVEPSTDCRSLPAAPGESSVGGSLIKLSCEKVDSARHRRVQIESRLLRKPGQAARNPFLETELTQGQFESSTRVEIYLIDQKS